MTTQKLVTSIQEQSLYVNVQSPKNQHIHTHQNNINGRIQQTNTLTGSLAEQLKHTELNESVKQIPQTQSFQHMNTEREHNRLLGSSAQKQSFLLFSEHQTNDENLKKKIKFFYRNNPENQKMRHHSVTHIGDQKNIWLNKANISLSGVKVVESPEKGDNQYENKFRTTIGTSDNISKEIQQFRKDNRQQKQFKQTTFYGEKKRLESKKSFEETMQTFDKAYQRSNQIKQNATQTSKFERNMKMQHPQHHQQNSTVNHYHSQKQLSTNEFKDDCTKFDYKSMLKIEKDNTLTTNVRASGSRRSNNHISNQTDDLINRLNSSKKISINIPGQNTLQVQKKQEKGYSSSYYNELFESSGFDKSKQSEKIQINQLTVDKNGEFKPTISENYGIDGQLIKAKAQKQMISTDFVPTNTNLYADGSDQGYLRQSEQRQAGIDNSVVRILADKWNKNQNNSEIQINMNENMNENGNNHEMDEIRAELSKLTERIILLEEEKQTMKQSESKLQKRNNQLEDQIQQSRQTQQLIQQKYSEIQSSTSTSVEKYQQLKLKYEQLSVEFNTYKSNEVQFKVENEDLAATSDEQATLIAQLQKTLTTLKITHEEKESEYQKIYRYLEIAENYINKFETYMDEKKLDYQFKAEKYEERIPGIKQEKFTKLQAEIQVQKEQIQNLQTQLSQLR